MYFNAQETRIPGLETTSHGWVSTYPLSQNAGRVKMVTCPLHNCLKLGVQSINSSLRAGSGQRPHTLRQRSPLQS